MKRTPALSSSRNSSAAASTRPQVPAVLVHNHGPFTWGKDADEAVYHAVVLEEVAFMNFHAKLLNPAAGPMRQVLLDKHYLRKHGANAYYGQG